MTSGHNRTERWLGTVRFRLPEDKGTPLMENAEIIIYDWHLAFAHGNNRTEIIKDLKRKVDELKANGRIIGGNSDPITLEQVITIVTTRTLGEFDAEVESNGKED